MEITTNNSISVKPGRRCVEPVREEAAGAVFSMAGVSER